MLTFFVFFATGFDFAFLVAGFFSFSDLIDHGAQPSVIWQLVKIPLFIVVKFPLPLDETPYNLGSFSSNNVKYGFAFDSFFN